MIVFNFLMNWWFLRKIYVNKNNRSLGKFILLGLIAALEFHILAGLKHILMDFHLGDSVAAARRGSVIVIVLTIISTGFIGAILW